MVGEGPEDFADGIFIGKDLVDAGAVEVSACQRSAVVEDEDQVIEWDASGGVAFSAVIIDIRLGSIEAADTVFVQMLPDQAVAIIPGVLLELTG